MTEASKTEDKDIVETGEVSKETGAPEESKEKGERRVPLAALHEERSKRKAETERVAKLEEELTKVKGVLFADQPHEDEAEIDPVALKQQLNNSIKNMELGLKLKLSETAAINKYGEEDYLEKIATFEEMIGKDPSLLERMQSESDPATFAYMYAKKRPFLENDDYEEVVSKKVRKELLDEIKSDKDGFLKKLESEFHPTMTDVKGLVSDKTTTVVERKSLDSILNKGR